MSRALEDGKHRAPPGWDGRERLPGSKELTEALLADLSPEIGARVIPGADDGDGICETTMFGPDGGRVRCGRVEGHDGSHDDWQPVTRTGGRPKEANDG